jgi:hypothetical protein
MPAAPTSISEISETATSLPINIDTEEEETLPTNHRDVIKPSIPNLDPESPDLQHALDDIIVPDVTPANSCRSTRIQNAKDAKAAGAPSRMDRIRGEVAESKARVEETRMEKRRKRLEDIREDERRNDPACLDEEARNDLQREEANTTTGGGMDGERVDEGQVADGEVSNL